MGADIVFAVVTAYRGCGFRLLGRRLSTLSSCIGHGTYFDAAHLLQALLLEVHFKIDMFEGLIFVVLLSNIRFLVLLKVYQ